MKKIYSLSLIFILIILVGCTQTQTLPYIKPISPIPDVSPATEPYLIKFLVVNPTINTFVGDLTYKYDTTCLTVNEREGENEVKVAPKNQYAVTKKFSFKGIDQYGRFVDSSGRTTDTPSPCLQTPIQISVSLRDASGELRDSEGFLVTFTR